MESLREQVIRDYEKTFTQKEKKTDLIYIIMGVAFFLSGMAGLIFEIVWFKLLGLAFGSSHIAVSVTVAVFMAGLALGGALSAKLVSYFKSPLAAYAIFEGLIGVYGLFVPTIISGFPAALKLMGFDADAPSFWLVPARVALAALALMPPTTLMGATLPILAGMLSGKEGKSGGAISFLYSLNTIGATVGVICAGFLIMPALGVRRANIFAAFVDISLAIVLYVILIKMERVKNKEAENPLAHPPLQAAEAAYTASPLARTFLFIAFFAGFVNLGYQMVWTRALATVLGSSTYAFTAILTTFLAGIAVGGFVAWRKINSLKKPEIVLSILLAFTALTAYLTSLAIDHLPNLVHTISKRPTFDIYDWIIGQFGIVMFVVFLPTIAMGAAFPLVVTLAAGSWKTERELTGKIGRAAAANMVGSILGSIVVGMYIIPKLRLDNTSILLVICSLALSILALSRVRKELKNRFWAFSGAAAALCVAIVLFTPEWNYGRWASGMFRFSVSRGYSHHSEFIEPVLAFYEDGLVASVTIERSSGGHLALKVNGKTDASSYGDMSTQVLSGAMPMLMHNNPKEVAVIGYGSGVTIGSVLEFPVERAVAVELEPAVLRAARLFAEFNNRPWENPKLTEIADDGRNYLEMTDRKFDVIISEPSNPWMTGASNLFTLDFWKLAASRLQQGGIFCQWIQLYELSSENVKILFNTFLQVFPEAVAFKPYPDSSDTILIGSMEPLFIDYLRWRDLWKADSALRAELQKGRVYSPEHLPALLLSEGNRIREWVKGAKTVTDDNALIEFSAPLDLVRFAEKGDRMGVLENDEVVFMDVLKNVRHNLPIDEPTTLAKMAYALLYVNKPYEASKLALEALDQDPELELARRAARLSDILGGYLEIPPWFTTKMTPLDVFAEPRRRYKKKEYYKALNALEDVYDKLTLFEYMISRAYLYLLAAAPYTALSVLEDCPPFDSPFEKLWVIYLKGVAYENQREFSQAIKQYEEYLIAHKEYEDSHETIIEF